MLVDSHCHVNFNAYRDDADEVIRRSLAKNIWLINVGSQSSTSKRTVEIATKYNAGVFAAVGLHPLHLIQDITETAKLDGKDYAFTTKQETFDYEKYKALALSSPKVVALGEVGLDYYHFNELPVSLAEAKKIQRQTLQGFLKLAAEVDLPLVLHCRGDENNPYEAYDDLFAEVKDSKIKGVVHCFGGTIQQAQKFVENGWLIGITGIVTFKKALETQKIAKELPLDKILVETDAPFLAPEPHRGERNEPAYVEFVARKIAELRGITFEAVTAATFVNTKKLFKISE